MSGTSSPRACVGDIGPLGREGSPRSALDGETGRGPAKQALSKKYQHFIKEDGRGIYSPNNACSPEGFF